MATNNALNDSNKFLGQLQGGLNGHLKPYTLDTQGSGIKYIPLPISVGSYPAQIAWCPTNQKIYACTSAGYSVSIINPITNTVIVTLSTGYAIGALYCPSNDRMYIGTLGGTAIVNPITNTIVSTISNPSHESCYVPSVDKIYLSDQVGNSIYVLDPSTNTVISTITGFSGNTQCLYCPTNDKVYVINDPAKTVNVVDVKSNTIVSIISLTDNRRFGCYCPVNDKIYLGNGTGPTIDIIDVKTDTIRTITFSQLSSRLFAPTFHPKRGTIFFTSDNNSTYYVEIDPTNDSYIVTPYTVGGGYYSPTYCPLNDMIYSGNYTTTNTVEIFG